MRFKSFIPGVILISIISISMSCYSQNLQWARQVGGANDEVSYSIAIDSSRYTYIAGSFQGTVDFDPGPAIYNLATNSTAIFILKLDAAGNFIWAKQMGGNGFSEPYCIALDRTGNIYVTGYFDGTADFDPGSGTFNLITPNSWGDAFICKLDVNGNFVWAESISGNVEDIGFSITTDDSLHVFATGYFQGTADLDPGPSVSNFTAQGYEDIYIVKLDSAGSLVWARQLGGNGGISEEAAYGIVVDDSGNVYTAGEHGYNADFDPGPGTFYLGLPGGFISKLDVDGNFVWAKNFIGTGTVRNYSLVRDNNGNIYSTGTFSDTAFGFVCAGNYDAFFLKLNSTGNTIWVKQVAGNNMVYGL